ncbi:type VI secretion system baseplate subunit TssE [Rhodovulum sp. MB263]|uniref:type VI secretion system baseplate subunit TssE n=1 Tax=unclassified Rhodovulum TaxID=2631432 RepID=UPI0009B76776|nr:type VI secretion system baseplate subunit TssE [Rhodovulum sp. MB263]ARC90731.1 hypothetical protein B5V46_18815 [Rhodovulum sp. MB263]
MAGPPQETGPGAREAWRDRDRAKISIFQIFRSAHEEHDARRANRPAENGETEVSARSKPRREGVSASILRAHLQADLDALLNTIRLDAATDLSDAPHVANSILNYGFRDLSSVSPAEFHSPAIVESIRESLLRHEPRFLPGTLEVRVVDANGDSGQRLSVTVEGELTGDPVDLSVGFDAEVDLGAGKMDMSDLRMRS